MKKIFFAVLFGLFIIFTGTTLAATAKQPSFVVKIANYRRSINVNFYNVNTAKTVTYELTYLSNGLEKGIFGSILPKEGNNAYRSMLLGTCSKNVCTYHKNIKNCILKITSKLKTGKTYIKTYKIKV